MQVTDQTATESLAERLASFFCGPQFQESPADTLERMKLYVLDTLAAALGGTTAESSRTMARALLGSGGGPATVFGTGVMASAADAALLNGAAAHALELDDDHRVSVIHPGAVVVPAAFAMAEFANASGRDFLRGVLAGYEVAIRIGEAFEGGRLYRNGFHPTAVCGVFGAAAAGACILGLDKIGFTRAMGIAGTQAAGSVEWKTDGSWIKRLHPGRSAQSGIIAALLARQGFTAPATIFEGEFGIFRAMAHGQAIDSEALTRRLGIEFRALGTAIKPYPCCRFSHGTLDLAIEAYRRRGAAPIRSVEVRVFQTDVLTYHPVPRNAVEAQFNVPYLVATALTQGAVRLSDFTDAAIQRPDVLALAGRVTVVEDAQFSAAYPEVYHAVLDVHYEDGTHKRLQNDCPSGDPEAALYREDPAAFGRETVAKAHSVLGECGFGARSADLVRLTGSLDHAANVRSLSEIMLPPPS